MPTPVSLIKNVGIIQYLPDTFMHRPNHAKTVMTVIATNAYIDTGIVSLLGLFTKTPGEVSLAMLATIDSDKGKLKAVNAAAAAVLTKEDFILFQSVMHVVHSVKKTRNAFAHNHWGLSNELPNYVFLSDARSEIKTRNKFVDAYRFNIPIGENDLEDDWNLHLEAQGYNTSDLLREQKRANEARSFLSALYVHLLRPEDGQQRQWLLQDHQLKQKYDRLHSENVRP